MAHCEKFKLPDIKRVASEWSREKQFYKNDVDISRSNNNYSFGSHSDSDELTAAINNRIALIMGNKTLRKDAVGVVSWVVTCPPEFKNDEQQQRAFFQFVYEYTCDRYGDSNVMGGYVHCDETSPHIHIPVVPVVTDSKTGKSKLCAKEFTAAKELQGYQRDLEAAAAKQFGIDGLILNGRTKGDYTLSELKSRTADEKQISERENSLSKRINNVKKQLKQIEDINNKLDAKKTRLDERETDLNDREYRVRRRETDADKRKKSLDDREAELNERETRVQQYEEQTLKWADNYTDAVKEELEEEKKKLLEEFQQQLDERERKAAAHRREEYLRTMNDLYTAYNEFKQDAEREFTSIRQKAAYFSHLDTLSATAEKKMQSAAAPQKTDEYQK